VGLLLLFERVLLEDTAVCSVTNHLKEYKLADLSARPQPKRMIRCIVDFKHLAIVDTGVHEASSNVHEQAKTSETRATLYVTELENSSRIESMLY
jgi:hypothetical protein